MVRFYETPHRTIRLARNRRIDRNPDLPRHPPMKSPFRDSTTRTGPDAALRYLERVRRRPVPCMSDHPQVISALMLPRKAPPRTLNQLPAGLWKLLTTRP